MNATHPSLPAIPRWRAFLNSFRFVRDPLGVMTDNVQRLGPNFRTYIGGLYPGLLTIDPAVIQHVLQKNHRNYRKSPIQFEVMAHYLGNGLLTSEGEYWLRQRRLIQPGFHRQRLARLTGIMTSVIDESIDRIDTAMEADGQVDIYQHMMELAFRIMARSIFSSSMNEKELHSLSHNITVLQEFIIRQIRQPYFRPWRQLNGQVGRHEALAAEGNAIILDYIRRRRREGGDYDDLLQMLLDVRYEDTGEGMSDRQLLDEANILLIAGHETSANALAWTWYLLSQHPQVLEKMRREHEEVLGQRSPAFADLPQLSYTLQVIEESMRLFPPAWITDRVALDDDHIAGVDIRKGETIIIYIYGAHHDPAHWPEPERFDPERFQPERKKKQPPFSYLPFGGGPRLCIGNNFALMEMQLVLAMMARRYQPELVPGQQIVRQPLITLRPKYGVKLKMKRKNRKM